MIAVILAAGMASRLRPLTDTCPKCLLSVGERTLLGRAVDALVDAGISELVVVTGYRESMIRTFLQDNYPSLTIHFIQNEDYQTTNNIYSLWLSRPFVDGRDFFLMDSDILFDPAILPLMLSQDASALALNRHELGEEEMKVVVDAQGTITQLNKTCRVEDAAGESVGFEKINGDYSTALFRELEAMIEGEGLVDVFYERAFERLIPKGFSFKVVDTTDYFSTELDTVDDFNHAREIIPQNLY